MKAGRLPMPTSAADPAPSPAAAKRTPAPAPAPLALAPAFALAGRKPPGRRAARLEGDEGCTTHRQAQRL